MIKELVNSEDRLKNKKIKSIRQLICTICNSRKPWEVVVGQAIGSLAMQRYDDNSLYSMIGNKACDALLGLTDQAIPEAKGIE